MSKEKISILSAMKTLMYHLKPVLGVRRFIFMLRVFLQIPYFKKKFFKNVGEKRILNALKTFMPVISAYYELSRIIGDTEARKVISQFLFEHTLNVQRAWYLGEDISKRSWDAFHDRHEYMMKTGIIKNNIHDKIQRGENTYKFDMLKCSFHEVFSLAGIPWLTDSMCKTDEIVFNEYSSSMKFHRGEGEHNTLGRNGLSCAFIFEKVNNN